MNTEITVHVEVITPEKAKEYLATMMNNRHLSKGTVIAYATDIRSNNWDPTSMIAFDRNGHLIDGQHRLNAVIAANLPATFVVMRNASEDSVFDRGRLRSVSDVLKMTGKVSSDNSSTCHGGVAKLCIRMNSKSAKESRVTVDQVAEFINAHSESMNAAIRCCSKGTPPITKKAACIAAAMYALERGINSDLVSDFFKIVNSGYAIEGSHDPSAPQTLRRHIQEDLKRTSSAAEREKLCMVTEMAINDFANNAHRTRKYTVMKHIYFRKEANEMSE